MKSKLQPASVRRSADSRAKILLKLFNAVSAAAFTLVVIGTQVDATEQKATFSWHKCMAHENAAGFDRWKAARRCAKVQRNHKQ